MGGRRRGWYGLGGGLAESKKFILGKFSLGPGRGDPLLPTFQSLEGSIGVFLCQNRRRERVQARSHGMKSIAPDCLDVWEKTYFTL